MRCLRAPKGAWQVRRFAAAVKQSREDELVVKLAELVRNTTDANVAQEKHLVPLAHEYFELSDAHPPIRTARQYFDKLLKDQRVTLQLREKTKAEDIAYTESGYSCFRPKHPPLVARNAELARKCKRFLVFDFETTTKVVRKRVASPFSPDNRVVYAAWSHHSDPEPQCKRVKDTGEWWCLPDLSDVDILVGHNVKFDLLYCWNKKPIRDFLKRGGMIWDTMNVEYLIRGHREGSLRLDSLALRYGLPLKDQAISEQWKAGVCTTEIDETMMIDYNKHDVNVTRRIFERQFESVNNGSRLPVIISHMEGLLATTDMEWNGLFVNGPVLADLQVRARTRQQALKEALAATPPEEVVAAKEENPDVDWSFNWESTTQLRCWLFGGSCQIIGTTMSYPKKRKLGPDGEELPGKLVAKKTLVKFPGVVSQEWRDEHEKRFSQAGPITSVTSDVLECIQKHDRNPELNKTITTLLELKQVKKVLSTYMENFDRLSDDQGIIHHELKHCQTRTGRLCSQNPNMQNVPRETTTTSDYVVKDCLSSRFGKDGFVIESDYSQVEVFVLATLSQDQNLIQELAKGTDLHCKRLALKERMPYDEVVRLCKKVKDPAWVSKRQQAKSFQFQRQYGAGKNAIAANTGLSIEEVEHMIELEEQMYPQVVKYYDRVMTCLDDTLGRDRRDPNVAFYDAPSGNRWYFRRDEEAGGLVGRAKRGGFKRQLVLNHPVQGFAAELLLTCLGHLWRHFLQNDNYGGKACLVNTVHDCVWVDTSKEVGATVADDIHRIMSAVQTCFAPCGYAIDVWPPYRCETYAGKTMSTLEPVQVAFANV